MGEIRPKTCEGRGLTKNQLVYDTVGLKDDGQHAMAKLKPHGFFVTIAGGTAPAPRADVKQVSIHGWMKNGEHSA